MNKPEKSDFIKIISASSIGTILEWYDFSLFAYLTPILAKLFFPEENILTGLMLTYAIFAVGYFVRPLGAILFGHLGDRIGRKKTLVWTILLMSLSTVFIGLLPTYQSLGILAPILLIIFRIGQGLAVGGESTGAVLFALESLPSKHRGFYSGLLWSMVGVGMLLGSFAATLVLRAEQADWLWRLPFLVGLATGVLGYLIRTHTPESILFSIAKQQGVLVKFPLWNGITQHTHAIFSIIGLYILSAMITYLIFIFMPTYAANIIGLPLAQTSLISTCAFFASTIFVPIGGYLSDLLGRKQCLTVGALGFMAFSYPLFQMIAQGGIADLIFAEIIFLIIAGLFQGSLTAAILEMLPLSIRYSIAAVGYNVSYSIFGGTAPLIASALVNFTGNKSAPGIYLVMGAILALIALTRMPALNYEHPL